MNKLYKVLFIFITVAFCWTYFQLKAQNNEEIVVKQEWMNVKLSPEERARQLLDKMDLDQKIGMLHGNQTDYSGYVPAIPSLNIPSLLLNDGPQGFRDDNRPGTTTCFPSGLTVSASFDLDLAYVFGKTMGNEFFYKGANVQLGPGMNTARVQYNGRNFEYSAGEDPFLGYKMVQPVVKGIQEQNVIATAKHWVQNSQETNRTTVSENNVDERQEFEIYYPPFEGAIEAGAGSVMCSYNLIHDKWSCENPTNLAGHLKKDLNFTGWVMSDWWATHSTSIQEGLDQEMPDDTYFGATLKQMVISGQIDVKYVNESVYRILYPMFKYGLFDYPNNNTMSNNVTSDNHADIAKNLSIHSTVLLKNNDNILPIAVSKYKNYGVFGSAADKNPIFAGDGSGHVQAPNVVTTFWGIRDRLGFPRPTSSSPYTDCYNGICLYYDDGSDLNKSTTLAKSVDLCIIDIATTSGEGSDRVNLKFGNNQEELVQAVGQANPNSIVVFQAPGPVLTQWQSYAKAIVTNIMPGQQGGNALAQILFGDMNPCGRLPFTLPNAENEMQFTQLQYPGINNENNYTEFLSVGYRWYNAHNVTPAYPFGFGLSYTIFEYSLVSASDYKIQFSILNAGLYYGCEIAQLYLTFPTNVDEPPKQLKGFQKICIQTAQTKFLNFELTDRDISIWDTKLRKWVKQTGTFTFYIGGSSMNQPLSGNIHF